MNNIKDKYDYVGEYHQGVAIVVKDNKYGAILVGGHEIIPTTYDYISTFKDGYAQAIRNGECMIINLSGQKCVSSAMEFIEIGEKYDVVRKFYNGLACVCKGDRWGVIDEKGNKFAGVNWEPANGDSTCGEVGAISNYVLSDRLPIKYILTYGYPKNTLAREDSFCTPCGRCRQRLLDYVNKDTICYGINETGTQVKEFAFDELLPHSFSSANLNE